MYSRKQFLFALAAVALIWAVPANAGPIGPVIIAPANSWSATWTDTTGGKLYDMVEFFVTGGGFAFDAPASTSQAGWSGFLVNPLYSYISGPAASADKVLTLFFEGNAPSGGVRVDIIPWYQGSLVAGEAWRWTNLPNQNWEPITTPGNYDRTPVPEGGSLLVMLGMGIMAIVGVCRRI